MKRFRVLVTAPYFLPVLEDWRPELNRHGIDPIPLPVIERAEEDDLMPVTGDVHGVICGDDKFTRRVLENAPLLRVLCKWGTGIDSIDQETCRRLGIEICNTKDAFSLPVADTVLGYALTFQRNISFMDSQMKSGTWKKIPGRSLSESTFGVIGVGNVGRRVMERAAAFGSTLLGTDIREIDKSWREKTGMAQVSLDELLERSDIVSVNCDLNPTSYHLITDGTLEKMKKSAVLINTARGPIVDEPALINALKNGRIAGAGLEVFEQEPLSLDSPLRRFPNVLLAPHNSNSSPRAWRNVHENTVKSLVEALEGPDMRRGRENEA
jgi:D-3-phosphoglycerate dehydrogenase